jgi:hypothetical protein
VKHVRGWLFIVALLMLVWGMPIALRLHYYGPPW